MKNTKNNLLYTVFVYMIFNGKNIRKYGIVNTMAFLLVSRPSVSNDYMVKALTLIKVINIIKSNQSSFQPENKRKTANPNFLQDFKIPMTNVKITPYVSTFCNFWWFLKHETLSREQRVCLLCCFLSKIPNIQYILFICKIGRFQTLLSQ